MLEDPEVRDSLSVSRSQGFDMLLEDYRTDLDVAHTGRRVDRSDAAMKSRRRAKAFIQGAAVAMNTDVEKAPQIEPSYAGDYRAGVKLGQKLRKKS